MTRPHKTTLLSSSILAPIYAHELCGDKIISRLFGCIPIQTIHLSEVHYLRLATRDEVSAPYILLNWAQFLPHRRSIRPVYILQSHNHFSLFLNLDGRIHFKLRQAIARNQARHTSRMAA